MADPITDELARELLAVHEDSYGKSAESIRVHLLEDDVIVFLDGIELQRNEEFLIEKGRSDLVLATRSGFQQSIETTFRAIVERATGRTVTAFLSATSLDPPFCVETFRLAPLPDATDPFTDW
jgi:uncharacterized protein YbcI